MIIKKAEFLRSIKTKDQHFNKVTPEIAFVGKSNAGKSSLINYLTNNGKLARVSKQPGKTRLINYFMINDSFYMVDLPGYGYAKASREEQKSWDEMMYGYFDKSQDMLKCVFILIDIRRDISEEDKAAVALIESFAIPYCVIATKADKISKSKRFNEMMRIRRNLPTSFSYNIIAVSSLEKKGKDDVLKEIERLLQDK